MAAAYHPACGFLCGGSKQGSTAELMGVHGAGSQRSDPKSGNPADYPRGRWPQCDAVRINNFVRLVRVVK